MRTYCARLLSGIALLTAIMLVCPEAGHAANVKGSIKKKSGQVVNGLVRWLPSEKVYKVVTGQVDVTVPLADVADISVEKPAAIDDLIKKIQGGQAAGAVAGLDQIVKDYAMLQYDVVGTRWLAEAYLKGLNDPKKAAEVCDTLMHNNPKAFESGELAYNYWDALLKTQQYTKLEEALTLSVQKAPREVAAIAQLKRGDMAMQKGNNKDALVDGYLRTVFFFQSVKSVQPEALSKAAKCFEALGRVADAEKMRKKLLADYPNSPLATQAQ